MHIFDRFKFRVFDKISKTIIFHDNLALNSDGVLFKFTKENNKLDIDNCLIRIMQCTGLKDKHNNLIYEGDVLRRNRHTFQIGFENGYYYTQNIGHFSGNKFEFSIYSNFMDAEIIGNIYENPNLIVE